MMELERREGGVRLGVGEERSEGLTMERGDMGSVEKKEPRHFCETDFQVSVCVSSEQGRARRKRVEESRTRKRKRKKKGEVSSTSSGFLTVTVSFSCAYTRFSIYTTKLLGFIFFFSFYFFIKIFFQYKTLLKPQTQNIFLT